MKTRFDLRQYVGIFSNTSVRRQMILHWLNKCILFNVQLYSEWLEGMLTHETAQRHNETVQFAQKPALFIGIMTWVPIENVLPCLPQRGSSWPIGRGAHNNRAFF